MKVWKVDGKRYNMYLQGYIDISYKELVEIFGEPNGLGDGYKVDAEWILKYDNEYPISIYNYKNGKNYCGADGYDVEDITDWHIGGSESRAVEIIENKIKEHRKKKN